MGRDRCGRLGDVGADTMRPLARLFAPLTAFMACATTAGPHATPKFVTAADGARVAYYAPAAVKGVPLLVLSGGPGTDSRYMRVGGALDRLADSRSLVSFDQRGTGRSSAADGGATIDRYVEDLERIRQAIGAPRLDLMGHSFGGYLAIAYTAKYPYRVRGLVLVDSAQPKLGDVVQLLADIYPDRIEAWRAKRATLGDDNPSSASATFMRMEFVTEKALADYLAAVADHRDNMSVNNALRRDMEKLDYWPQVRRFTQPTLIVHGRFDAVVAPSNGWKLHQAIPGSTFRIIESAGHLPHIEKPAEFLAVVEAFLRTLDATVERAMSAATVIENVIGACPDHPLNRSRYLGSSNERRGAQVCRVVPFAQHARSPLGSLHPRGVQRSVCQARSRDEGAIVGTTEAPKHPARCHNHSCGISHLCAQSRSATRVAAPGRPGA